MIVTKGEKYIVFLFGLGIVYVLTRFFNPAQRLPYPMGCMGNLKQLGLGVVIYAEDYDRLPQGSNWCTVLEPYIPKNSQLFICPALKDRQLGYAMNSLVSGIPNPKNGMFAPMLFDSKANRWNEADPLTSVAGPERHNGYVNVAFTDTHVKSLKIAGLTPKWIKAN